MLRNVALRAAERAFCGMVAGVFDNPPGFPYTNNAWCRYPGGREAHLQQCGGQFAWHFAEPAVASGAVSKPDGFSQVSHLPLVGRLIVVSDKAYHHCVVSKFDDDVGAVCAVQSCVYREYRSGLRTQPCGAPVLRIRGDDVLLPILTTWLLLLPVRKSRIQLHRDLFSPSVWSLATSVAGTMVLNAEL